MNPCEKGSLVERGEGRQVGEAIVRTLMDESPDRIALAEGGCRVRVSVRDVRVASEQGERELERDQALVSLSSFSLTPIMTNASTLDKLEQIRTSRVRQPRDVFNLGRTLVENGWINQSHPQRALFPPLPAWQ